MNPQKFPARLVDHGICLGTFSSAHAFVIILGWAPAPAPGCDQDGWLGESTGDRRVRHARP